MLRIHCTADDLLRCRFVARPAPLVELVLALMMLRRRDRSLFDSWRRRTWLAFPRDARPLLDLVFANSGPEYLDCLASDFDEAVDTVLTSTPPAVVRVSLDDPDTPHPATPWLRLLAEGEREAQEILRLALRSAHESLLGGSWTRVRDSVQTDLAYRNHLVVTQGIGPALTTVIPGLRWSGTVLEIPRSRSVELHLRGGGITLLPTAFWTGPPLFSRPVQDRPMLIVYPATPLPLIIDAGAEPTRALAALLGRTRAAVLEAITAAPATTSELARRLNISPGRASEHASVLRDAGLITSHRHRNRVLHTATPLSLRIGTPAR